MSSSTKLFLFIGDDIDNVGSVLDEQTPTFYVTGRLLGPTLQKCGSNYMYSKQFTKYTLQNLDAVSFRCGERTVDLTCASLQLQTVVISDPNQTTIGSTPAPSLPPFCWFSILILPQAIVIRTRDGP